VNKLLARAEKMAVEMAVDLEVDLGEGEGLGVQMEMEANCLLHNCTQKLKTTFTYNGYYLF